MKAYFADKNKGEICMKGPSQFLRYLKDEEKTIIYCCKGKLWKELTDLVLLIIKYLNSEK